jgi:hypothetical protein
MTTGFVNDCTLLIEQMAKITINRNGNAIARTCPEGSSPNCPPPELRSGQQSGALLGHRARFAIAYIIGIISICLHNQSITGNLDVKALTVGMTKKGEE